MTTKKNFVHLNVVEILSPLACEMAICLLVHKPSKGKQGTLQYGKWAGAPLLSWDSLTPRAGLA